MKILLLAVLALAVSVPAALAQNVEIKRDNGTVYGSYQQANWEESVILKPDGPCTVTTIKVYYAGTTARKDTLYVVGDPSAGAIPPTSYVWPYNTLIPPIIVSYNGAAGWKTIDVSKMGLHADGYDGIIVQHRIRSGGPFFAIDNDGVDTSRPYTSFIYRPDTSNSLGFPGITYLTQGDYMIRLVVKYDFPSGNTSQAPPAPTLVDVAKEAGLTDAGGDSLRAAMVSVADWNGDGFDDIAIGSSFFRNRHDGTFEDVSGTIGIQAQGTAWGDFDNDGKLDCYANNGGAGDRLYHNNGDGTFSDVTSMSKLTNDYPTVTPIWLDYDRDGRLDLFIANGRTESGGQEEYFPDQLWRNNGDGTFINVTQEAGIAAGEPAPYYDCWGASTCDYNNDGRPDIFVSTYRLAPDLLYRNNGDGTFTEVGAATGVRGVPTADPNYFGHGMGSDWGDYNNDGLVDLVVGNLGHPDWRGQVSNPSMIFRNDGPDGGEMKFTEVHHDLGIKFFEMNSGVAWLDLDLDGNLDLWHSQYAYNPVGVNGEPERLSRIYLNQGADSGYRFRDMTWNLGSIIHGAWAAARIDFDNDGDIDLVVASPTDAVRLFRNDLPRRGHWLGLRLKGKPDAGVPLDAYGASAIVYADGKKFYRALTGGGARTMQHTSELHFGLGDVTKVDSVVIHYSNDTWQTLTDIQFDRIYTPDYAGQIRAAGVDEAPPELDWSISDPRYTGDRFTFDLKSSGVMKDVDVEIVNSLGLRVASARIGKLTGGGQSLRASVASGLYVIRVASEGRSVVGKVMVVK
jgi:hypothetical protein